MTLIKGLKNVDINQAKHLFKEAFGDSDAYIDLYYSSYEKNNEYYFYVDDNNNIISMACANKKRLFIDGEKKEACLIVAVATKKEFQGKGIMKQFFQKWLDEISFYYEYIFIQAYNWNVYKSYDFHTCCLKNEYTLRHDQYLKPCEYFDSIDYDRIIDIKNQFLKIYNIENFIYKTKKENQLYHKMVLAANEKIYMNKNSFIVVSDNKYIVDFGFVDLKEFIKLLSNFKDNPFILKSYIKLDKRFFTLLNENVINAKIYQKEGLDIYFDEEF